jgi:hypothetical protein
MIVADPLAEATARWDKLPADPSADVTRLAILRELARAAHARHSRVLAGGEAGRTERDPRAFRDLEARAERLRDRRDLARPLSELLAELPPARVPEPRPLPSTLPSLVATGLRHRPDRLWEIAIVAEASRHGYRFWALEGRVQLRDAERVHRQLEAGPFPRALVLYAETADHSAPRPFWDGRWVLAAEPAFEPARDVAPPPELLSPAWRLLS